ncbi:MAG TPA: hypothetical protein VJU85_02110 [Nitrososphaeraceae archaeon]|nr:hypothetical protein [Nitrososphaeraceae archaeon]
MAKESILSKYTVVGAGAIVFGFFEGLGNDLYHYLHLFKEFHFLFYSKVFIKLL